MNTVFIDSNVILYLLSGDSAKANRAEAILGKGGIISVQVLNEVTSVCFRKLTMTWEAKSMGSDSIDSLGCAGREEWHLRGLHIRYLLRRFSSFTIHTTKLKGVKYNL